MPNALAILLAGGAGERLYPLTRNIAKPAVPFGGIYRIIDFTLSNCINSNIRRIFILTQYKALELTRHVREGWSILSPEVGEFIEVIPPMKRVHEDWYLGTADAVFQNAGSILAEAPSQVLLLSGDHIYKMNYLELLDWHLAHQADVTIATTQTAPEEAHRFGIMEIDADHRIVGFEEKPRHGNPVRSGFNPSMVSASMGVYVFRTEVLLRALQEDADDPASSHDFGGDLIPSLIGRARAIAYDFHDLNDKTARYWRDVGTVDAYYEANMDVRAIAPELNLYNRQWPLITAGYSDPPAKFVFDEAGRRGQAIDSVVAGGTILSGGMVRNSVLGRYVRVHSAALVEDSIIFDNCDIGRRAKIRRAILDKNVKVLEDATIGYDLASDLRSYHVTEGGIVVVEGPRSRVELSTLIVSS